MTGQPPIVFVIDDDAAMRNTLRSLIRSVGLKVKLCGSPRELLKQELPDAPSCLILEVRFPGENGLDFQRELAARNIHIPIIFVTGHGDMSTSVRAMKSGAVDFLTKPLRDQDLLDAIQIALRRDEDRRHRDAEMAALRERHESLTLREREVVSLVVAGMPNKQIAARIGTVENTVKVHRSRAMGKMHARSLADLVKMIEKLQSATADS